MIKFVNAAANSVQLNYMPTDDIFMGRLESDIDDANRLWDFVQIDILHSIYKYYSESAIKNFANILFLGEVRYVNL